MVYAQLLFPDFSLILCGYLVCRYTALNRSLWTQVDALVYYLLFPVLLFHAIIRNPLDLQAASSLITAGVSLGLLGIALSFSLPHWPLLRGYIAIRTHAPAAQVAFRFNSFIALALADRLGGPGGLQLMAVLGGFCVPMFNVAAVWAMARHGERGFLRELLRNPLVVATLSALGANLAGLSLPAWLEPSFSRIGGASLALGLMAAGAGMQFGTLVRAKALAVALLSIRHLILPLMAFGLVRLFQLAPGQALVLMIFSAAPTASSAYVLAARMGYDGSLVAALVTLSTLLGMVSLPLALGLLS
ncbi:MAG: AEC family transporter [Rhodoferax sp.]|nr:AEC family transporter [Rhodoferax sp.]